MKEKTDYSSLITNLIDEYAWAGKKHQAAIMVLIERICDIEKHRRPRICPENIAIDEVVEELLESLKCLLVDAEKK